MSTTMAAGSAPATVPTVVAADPLPTPATQNIEVHVGGNLTGQLAVGDNNLQIEADHGAVVTIYEGKPVVPRRRAAPVLLPPRPLPGLLGRGAEVAAAKTAVRGAQPFEYYALPGWGKTALLRYLGQVAGGSYPDGVVYQSCGRQPLADLLQFLFDAFYETDVPFKPTAGQLREALAPLRAVVLLDDLDLDRDQVDELLTSMPQSVFLLASRERTLWGSGQAEAVAGLDKDAAVELYERELGRLLTTDEQPAFDRLWSGLEGNPLGLIEAAALAREHGRSVSSLGATDPAIPVAEQLTTELVSVASEDERKVLGLLASVYDVALPAEHVAAITGIAGSAALLAHLTQQGLTEAVGSGYRLKLAPAAAVAPALAPQQWTDPAILHFATWADQFASHPRLILETADVLVKVLELAADSQRHWSEAMRLVRAVEPSLARAARWSAWQRVLNSGLQAAHALGDKAAEAWVLHQLGTRSLCLGQAEAARTFLQQALEIRGKLGDAEGAAVTDHNLQRLATPPVRRIAGPIQKPRHGSRLTVVSTILSVLVLVFGVGGIVANALGGGTLTFEPSQNVDAGTVPVGESRTRSLTIHNTGHGKLVLRGLATTGDFTVTSDCPLAPEQLRPDQACLVDLAFRPAAPGQSSGTLTVTEASGVMHKASLAGVGAIGTLAFTPAAIDFGSQPVGSPGPAKDVTIRNTGNAPMAIKSIATSSNEFTETSDCPVAPMKLAPGQTCLVHVSFSPATAGPRSGALTVAEAGGVVHSASLAGTGAVGALAPTPAAIDFGNQPVGSSSPARDVTVRDTGAAPIAIKSIATSSNDFTETSDCPLAPQTLAPGQSCLVHVAFSPATTGPHSGALAITDAGGMVRSTALAGIGTAGVIAVTPTAIDFGTQTVGIPSAAKAVTVRNTGTASIAIQGVAATGDFQVGSQCPSSPSTLDPGQSCTLTVTFIPKEAGHRTGSLAITDPSGTHAVQLTGLGIFTWQFRPNPVNFGSVAVGTSQTREVQLLNTSGAPLPLSQIGTSTKAFVTINRCLALSPIPPQGSCYIYVSFTPQSAGPQSAALIVTDTAGDQEKDALTGVGLGQLSLSTTTLSVWPGSSGSITLTNVGTVAVPITGITTYGTDANGVTKAGWGWTQKNTCPALLAPSAACTITVTSVPTAGVVKGSLVITDYAVGSPQTVLLTYLVAALG